MTLVQDGVVRDYQQLHFELVLVNEDDGSAGKALASALEQSPTFKVVTELNGQPATAAQLQEALQMGVYAIGVVIPKGTTAALVRTSNEISNVVGKSMGAPPAFSSAGSTESPAIQLYFDPTQKPAFRSSLHFAISQYIGQIKMELLMDRLTASGAGLAKGKEISATVQHTLPIIETAFSSREGMIATPNSTQHNVPAWTIFGMFLIVVPIAGNLIREREDGSAMRVQLIPNATLRVDMGKLLFYIMFCLLQFVCMMLVGVFIIPLFHLPSLSFGHNPWNIVPVAIGIAFGATSYGYFIGKIFKTANQAMPFGAISVALLAALGGVWVPMSLMPKSMETIVKFSPMYWSLEGINKVFLSNATLAQLLPSLLAIFGFGIIFTALSLLIRKGK